MHIDPRLTKIDNALYRIATRADEFSNLHMGPMADDVIKEFYKIIK